MDLVAREHWQINLPSVPEWRKTDHGRRHWTHRSYSGSCVPFGKIWKIWTAGASQLCHVSLVLVFWPLQVPCGTSSRSHIRLVTHQRNDVRPSISSRRRRFFTWHESGASNSARTDCWHIWPEPSARYKSRRKLWSKHCCAVAARVHWHQSGADADECGLHDEDLVARRLFSQGKTRQIQREVENEPRRQFSWQARNKEDLDQRICWIG